MRQTYLVSTMESDGSFRFPDVGHWSINSELEGHRVAATAYVLRALLYSGYEPDGKTAKALDYIERDLRTDDGAFTLAVALTALEMASGSASLRELTTAKLVSIAKDGGDGTLYWEYSSGQDNRYYYGLNFIETTSYAVMGLSMHGGYGQEARAGIQYMLTHRDAGRWGSTHDTAVAFQALSLTGGFGVDQIEVEAWINGAIVAETTFTKDDEDKTFIADISSNLFETNVVELTSSGKGTIIYQIVVRENIPEPSLDPLLPPISLEVEFDKTQAIVGETITGSVRVVYTGEMSMRKLVLVDLRAPAGLCFKTSEFDQLLSQGIISMHETSCQRAYVYLENVEADIPIEFQFTLDALQPVRVTLQGINAFDMYDPTAFVYLPPLEIVIEE
ncbi:MAG: hypothetical protein ACE5IJ_10295 [Thermoplasmata archaeon]